MTIVSSVLGTVDLPVTLLSLLVVSILYFSYVTVYRLYLSPIAHFPGPRLAAWTYWYEFWYDVVAEPEYTFKIGRLHKEYGMFFLRLMTRGTSLNDVKVLSSVLTLMRYMSLIPIFTTQSMLVVDASAISGTGSPGLLASMRA